MYLKWNHITTCNEISQVISLRDYISNEKHDGGKDLWKHARHWQLYHSLHHTTLTTHLHVFYNVSTMSTRHKTCWTVWQPQIQASFSCSQIPSQVRYKVQSYFIMTPNPRGMASRHIDHHIYTHSPTWSTRSDKMVEKICKQDQDNSQWVAFFVFPMQLASRQTDAID